MRKRRVVKGKATRVDFENAIGLLNSGLSCRQVKAETGWSYGAIELWKKYGTWEKYQGYKRQLRNKRGSTLSPSASVSTVTSVPMSKSDGFTNLERAFESFEQAIYTFVLQQIENRVGETQKENKQLKEKLEAYEKVVSKAKQVNMISFLRERLGN